MTANPPDYVFFGFRELKIPSLQLARQGFYANLFPLKFQRLSDTKKAA
jgi:hypothetical protein